MFVMFEKGGHKYLVQVASAHDGDDLLTVSTPSSGDDDERTDVIAVPGFTMADLVQSMNAASQRGDCVAVLQSYRPKGAA